MKQFIRTLDEDTRDKLLSLGYKLVSESTNEWTFLNDSKLKFGEVKNVVYTDIMSM